MNISPLRLIDGGISVDDRGMVSYANEFLFDDVKRFYTIRNHHAGFVRAWHGHKKEGKYVLPLAGSILVGAVEIDNWDNPNKSLDRVKRLVLSEHTPKILYIPPGFANGFMTLTDNAVVMFFSTSTLEESKGDDYRFNKDTWDIWNIQER